MSSHKKAKLGSLENVEASCSKNADSAVDATSIANECWVCMCMGEETYDLFQYSLRCGTQLPAGLGVFAAEGHTSKYGDGSLGQDWAAPVGIRQSCRLSTTPLSRSGHLAELVGCEDKGGRSDFFMRL